MPAEGDLVNFQSGANFDTRSEEEKLKDYKFEEIVSAAAPVVWIEKAPNTWRRFPIFNQNGSGSCVAQTAAKLLGILRWLKDKVYIHFSATHIYSRRINKTQSGMGGVDVFNILKAGGATLEELTPSQNMSDQTMDSVVIEQYKKDVGTVFKIGGFIILPIKDIESVASVIQTTGKAVMVWFYFGNNGEWADVPKVVDPNLDMNAANRHSVTGVDFTLFNGKKSLIIDDSWGHLGGPFDGQRVITEDFFKTRNFFAAYPMSFAFDDQTQPTPEPMPVPVIKPKYTFTKVLEFGQTNPDIVALQKILRYEGLFPTNVNTTGYYGAITAKGVLAWQKKYVVAPNTELDPLMGRRVGQKTMGKLNLLYS